MYMLYLEYPQLEIRATMQSQKIVNNDDHKIADQQSQTKDIWFPMVLNREKLQILTSDKL